MTKRTAVLVTGSRDWTDYGPIRERLALYPSGTILLHGDCGRWNSQHVAWVGADKIAEDIASGAWTVWPLPYFADLGKAGGPARNHCLVSILEQLHASGFATFVEAFPMGASPGTRGCIALARRRGAVFSVNVTEGKP